MIRKKFFRRGNPAVNLNEAYETYLKANGAEFVRFVDVSSFPGETGGAYTCAVFFAKALSKEYLRALRDGRKPDKEEFGPAEHAMDALAAKLAKKLTDEGYESTERINTKKLPHKTVARMAGFGFIGKNTLLVSERFGCAAVLGKILTSAPFETIPPKPAEQKCGDCNVCAEICPTNALLGREWSETTKRKDMLVRKLCSPCLKCMVHCPFTIRYMEGE